LGFRNTTVLTSSDSNLPVAENSVLRNALHANKNYRLKLGCLMSLEWGMKLLMQKYAKVKPVHFWHEGKLRLLKLVCNDTHHTSQKAI
jgi:hypothetical protein